MANGRREYEKRLSDTAKQMRPWDDYDATNAMGAIEGMAKARSRRRRMDKPDDSLTNGKPKP